MFLKYFQCGWGWSAYALLSTPNQKVRNLVARISKSWPVIIFSATDTLFSKTLSTMYGLTWPFYAIKTMVLIHSDTFYRGHFVHARSQWETMLQCNVVYLWLSACSELSPILEYGLIIQKAIVTSANDMFRTSLRIIHNKNNLKHAP